MSTNTIGNQLMRLKPAKRRCPQCLGPIMLQRGCGNKGIPACEKCGFFPRGKAGNTDMRLTLDSTGTVTGWAREPENDQAQPTVKCAAFCWSDGVYCWTEMAQLCHPEGFDLYISSSF